MLPASTAQGFYDLLVQWIRHGGAASLARVDLLLNTLLHVARLHKSSLTPSLEPPVPTLEPIK